MGIRHDILGYLNANGLSTVEEIVDKLKLKRDTCVSNLSAARQDGLVERLLDETTGQPAYRLTALGKSRVNAAHLQINNKSKAENIAAGKVKTAVETSPEEREEKMPPADPVLLAKANRALSEQIDTLVGLLGCSGPTAAYAEIERLQALQTFQPIGYACVADLTLHRTEADVRSAADNFLTEKKDWRLHLVAVLDTAKMGIVWSKT